MDAWLMDETKPVDAPALEASMRKGMSFRTSLKKAPPLAVRINDLIIHDTLKWFGSADIRLDALVMYGAQEGSEESFYEASTFRFSKIKDNDRLPIEQPGQKIFYGWPAHFLDISLLVSRDTKDSDELSAIVEQELNSDSWKSAATAVLASATVPSAATVVGALGGAAVIANSVYKILKNTTGNTIGLYRTSWLQYRDRFGLGRHPEEGAFRQQDFSFWYDIQLDL